MGWFSREERVSKLNWNKLESIEQLKEAIEGSMEKPILLFKHSTRCSISMMALSSFEDKWDGKEEDIDIYFLDLLKHRDVSNAIAELTGVTHQSPQAIVVKNDEVVYHASHSSIHPREVLKSIR